MKSISCTSALMQFAHCENSASLIGSRAAQPWTEIPLGKETTPTLNQSHMTTVEPWLRRQIDILLAAQPLLVRQEIVLSCLTDGALPTPCSSHWSKTAFKMKIQLTMLGSRGSSKISCTRVSARSDHDMCLTTCSDPRFCAPAVAVSLDRGVATCTSIIHNEE